MYYTSISTVFLTFAGTFSSTYSHYTYKSSFFFDEHAIQSKIYDQRRI